MLASPGGCCYIFETGGEKEKSDVRIFWILERVEVRGVTLGLFSKGERGSLFAVDSCAFLWLVYSYATYATYSKSRSFLLLEYLHL